MTNKIFNVLKPYNDLDPVMVYRNLRNGMWSVMQRGIVVVHATHITLQGVTFKVREASRLKVIREKRKNVHAFVRGWLCDSNLIRASNKAFGLADDECFRHVPVSYNPYKAGYFYDKSTSLPVDSSDFCDMLVGDNDPVIAIWREHGH